MNKNRKLKIQNFSHKKLVYVLISLIIFLAGTIYTPIAQAQTLCDFGPCINEEDIGSGTDLEENVNSTIENSVKLVLNLVFVGIIILGIFYVIKAAMKIIRGEGDPGVIQEGVTTIKSVYFGVALIFAGIIGLVIVSGIFGATTLFNIELNEPEGINLPFID